MTTIGFTLPIVLASPSSYPALNAVGVAAILFCPLAAWIASLVLRALGYPRPAGVYVVAICACLTALIAGPFVHGIQEFVAGMVVLMMGWFPQLLWVAFFELCEQEERNTK